MHDELVVESTDSGVEVTPVTRRPESLGEAAHIVSWLGIKGEPNPQTAGYIKDIFAFLADGQAANEPVNQSKMLMELRHIEDRLKAPRPGQSRTEQIWNYIETRKALKRAQAAVDGYLR